MAQQTLPDLKKLVVDRWKPTVQQVKDWMDSFWHKSEKIPIASIDGLTELLNNLPNNSQGLIDVMNAHILGELVGFIGGSGFYDIPPNYLLEKVLIRAGQDCIVQIGITPGGNEIAVDVERSSANNDPIVIDRYAKGGALRIHFSGLPAAVQIVFFKRLVNQ